MIRSPLLSQDSRTIIECTQNGTQGFNLSNADLVLIGFEIRNSFSSLPVIYGLSSSLCVENCSFISHNISGPGICQEGSFNHSIFVRNSFLHTGDTESTYINMYGRASSYYILHGNNATEFIFQFYCIDLSLPLCAVITENNIVPKARADVWQDGNAILPPGFLTCSGDLHDSVFIIQNNTVKDMRYLPGIGFQGDSNWINNVIQISENYIQSSIIFKMDYPTSNTSLNTFNITQNTFDGSKFGALIIFCQTFPNNTVIISDNHFINNEEFPSVWLSWATVSTNDDPHNSYATTIISNNTFKNNTATGSGAALYLEIGDSLIQNCVFDSNSASGMGAAIYINIPSLGGFSRLATTKVVDVQNSLFIGNKALTGGNDISSTGSYSLSITNTSFIQHNQGVFISTPNLSPTDGNARVVCPAGHELIITDSISQKNYFEIPSHQYLIMSCTPCARDTYGTGLNIQEIIFDKNGTITHPTSSYKCNECPRGANCDGGDQVYAWAGFWCSNEEESKEQINNNNHNHNNNQTTITCTSCPKGYCREREQLLLWNETCIETRTGVLCGECVQGTSAAIWSTECVKNEHCAAIYWVLPLALFVGLCYLAFLIFTSVKHHPLWKSTTYFLQVLPLVLSHVDNVLLKVTTALFALDLTSLGVQSSIVKVCPYVGFNDLEKALTDYAIPAMLIFELLFIYLIHLLLYTVYQKIRQVLQKGRGPRRTLNIESDSLPGDASDFSVENTSRLDTDEEPLLLMSTNPSDGQSNYSPTTTTHHVSNKKHKESRFAFYAGSLMAVLLLFQISPLIFLFPLNIIEINGYNRR